MTQRKNELNVPARQQLEFAVKTTAFLTFTFSFTIVNESQRHFIRFLQRLFVDVCSKDIFNTLVITMEVKHFYFRALRFKSSSK